MSVSISGGPWQQFLAFGNSAGHGDERMLEDHDRSGGRSFQLTPDHSFPATGEEWGGKAVTVALPALDPELVDSLLAERDIQIAELQQAVVELSRAREENAAKASDPDISALTDRVAQLEAQLVEQQRTMRQTLAMLIEWIEGGDGSQKAA